MGKDDESKNEKALRKALKGEAVEKQPSGKVKPALQKILDEGKKGEEEEK